jgi:hypothetical protein
MRSTSPDLPKRNVPVPFLDSVADTRCLYRIPDPNFSIPDLGYRVKKIRIFFHPGSRILNSDRIPDPGVKKIQKSLKVLSSEIDLAEKGI